MRAGWAVIVGAVIIAASILFIGRWQIAAVGYGSGEGDTSTTTESIYRLDRWTGRISNCPLGGSDPKGYTTDLRQGKDASFDCRLPVMSN